MKGCTEFYHCLFQQLDDAVSSPQCYSVFLMRKREKWREDEKVGIGMERKAQRQKKLGNLDLLFSIFHALETGFEHWWLYVGGIKGVYEVARVASCRLGESPSYSDSPHPSSPSSLCFEWFFLPFQQGHATFTPPVFKINTWHQISPEYTQVGHPKLCCSLGVRFTCPFNKGSDPHCLSALPLLCQEAFLSLPYETGWTFSPCKHCSTSVHAGEHQSTTSQKPSWLCVTKCTAEEPARGQEFPRSWGWEESLHHNTTVTRIIFL